MSDRAKTYDDGKPPLAMLPLKALREVALVQLYGAEKYGEFFNYRKGMEVGRNASCAMRHIAAYMDGEDLDPESRRNHIAHAACRLLFILENLAEGTAIDDRYSGDGKSELQRLREQVELFKDLVETVAIGTRLECVKCGKFKPCMCDKGSAP